jgi:hypothetical protein
MSIISRQKTHIALALATFWIGSAAQAYPGFVAHGYTTCMACHYNPLGNGPLNDYGRALSATLISARPLWIKNGPEAEEETVAESGFLGPVKLPFWLRPALAYRGMGYNDAIESENKTHRWINMQADATLTLQSRDAKWIATATYGFIPAPATVSASQQSLYTKTISREHYLAYRGLKHVHFYLGLMDTAYGLRIPEHDDFIRQFEGRGKNDQNHGLLVNITDKKWDLFLNPVIGNLQQDTHLRQKGIIASYEREFFEGSRFGASVWDTADQYRYREMLGLYGKMELTKNGAGLLSEISLMRTGTRGADDGATGEVSFLQSTMVIERGWYFLFTLQNMISDFKSDSNRFVSAGPTLQWFPIQRIELRADLLTTRSLSGSNLAPDDYSALFQIHAWL